MKIETGSNFDENSEYGVWDEGARLGVFAPKRGIGSYILADSSGNGVISIRGLVETIRELTEYVPERSARVYEIEELLDRLEVLL